MQNIKILRRFAYFPPPVLGTAARLINIKALINPASHWERITVQDCKHAALGHSLFANISPRDGSSPWQPRQFSASSPSERKVTSSPFLFSSRFHVLLGPYSTGFHGMLNPRSSVISNTGINPLENGFPLLTVSDPNTTMKGSSRSTELWSNTW